MNSISNDSIVLVAGATGVLGGEICRQLIEEGRQVRALVRITSDTAKVAALKDMGVEVVEADLKDRASLAKAVSEQEVLIKKK
ncbi:MAG: SDR family NAD(P)-dependent oxidoreductase [Ferruginibacter sp.]|nr:SDR family NAD(P)-dependent oxidoreductase [Ferruginibacter sp.]